ncbi:hypothetical protein BO221_09730 [Archangium sp. Cb G35]|nr:hypothetical protein BO221_09730 [Archangium sp. Cb G35]
MREEAEEALRRASHRHPTLALSVRAAGAGYELVVEDEDFERYRDIVDDIVAGIRPTRFSLQAVERELARLVSQMLASAPVVVTDPANKICSLLEWRIVPELLELGSDGFDARAVRLLDRGVALAGRCWLFAGPGGYMESDFEAELTLGDDGALAGLDLAFGDPKSVGAANPRQPAPEHAERFVAGYRVVTQTDFDRWAFRVTRRASPEI